jgi:gliding motility-associated-like protein
MSNFNEIIKQKVEQFEVPYNEAHWAEMDGKLNSIRLTKIKNNIFGSAAVVAVVAISSYFIFSEKNTTIKKDSNINTEKSTSAFIVSNVTPVKVDKTIPNNNEDSKVNDIIDESIAEDNNSKDLSLEPTDFTNNKNIDKSLDEQDKKSDNKILANDNSINSEFFVYNNKVCLGEAVSFEAMENDEPVSYTWNFGDGTISHKANPKHRYEDSHVYSVSLTLLNRQTGKEYTSIQEDVVTIMPNPKASFSYTEVSVQHDDNKLKHPYTTFKIKDTSKKNTYSWNFGNGETSKSTIAKTIYKKKGSYSTTLTVKNPVNGCVSIVEEKINIKQGIELFAPNAFTPNGNGGNETFIPKALLGWDVQFEMTVIDKAGTLIYKTSDKSVPWNGKMNNTGNILNEGVYMWQVIIYDAEGSQHRYHDQIHLIK